MKELLILLVLLTSEKECNQKSDLSFIKATSQNWTGGPAATRGTYYKIYFLMKGTTDYTFDSLWVNDKRIPVSIIKSKTPADTLLVIANDNQGFRAPGTQTEMTSSVPAKFPIDVKAEGVLGYHYKGEKKYFPIPQWNVLKPITYQ
jgi:hypothetical protein